jgi:hypothetical protein
MLVLRHRGVAFDFCHLQVGAAPAGVDRQADLWREAPGARAALKEVGKTDACRAGNRGQADTREEGCARRTDVGVGGFERMFGLQDVGPLLLQVGRQPRGDLRQGRELGDRRIGQQRIVERRARQKRERVSARWIWYCARACSMFSAATYRSRLFASTCSTSFCRRGSMKKSRQLSAAAAVAFVGTTAALGYSGSHTGHIQNPTCLKKPLASLGERVCKA